MLKLGDVRISFQAIRPATVSLVGVQTAGSFAPYQAGDATVSARWKCSSVAVAASSRCGVGPANG